LLLMAGSANALPTGPQVISGTAGINTVGNTMTITNSANAILNWQGFNIGSNETTRFIQPSALSAVLNRITGGNPSQILGTLQSNGKVLLINPSGIIFGQGARVDVNGLIASSLDITNQGFLAGKMKFTAGTTAGKVENQGTITTPSGGSVYLIAPDLTNSGVITAPNGDVLLAAGKEVLLVDSINPEIAMVVTAPDGQAFNLGTIVADAGRVGMYGSIVRQKGRISASSAVQDASGRIFLKGTKETTLDTGSITTANGINGGEITAQSTEGVTLVSGTIEAKGTGGAGGVVQILGQHAGLIDSAAIDASGTTGGGTVLVGGDYQGKNLDIQNAEATYMGKDTVIKADATDNGNGGKVVIWADNTTRAYGSISARGGANGGDGGFVETSGKGYLDFNADVSTLAPDGKAGTLLLDPTNIWIATDQTAATSAGMPGADTSITTNGGPNFAASGVVDDSLLTVSALQTALAGGNVTVSTVNASGSGAGNITVANPVSFTSNNLTLNAENNIDIISGITSEGTGTVISLNAGNQINLTGSIAINFNADSFGAVNLNAGSGGITGAGQIEALQLKVLSGGSAAVKYMVQNLAAGPESGIVAANVTAGNLTFNMNGSDGAYSVGSIGGTNGITASGDITLTSAGSIAQTQPIIGNLLATSSVGGTTLTNISNTVTDFTATNTTSGNIELTNTAALLTLNGLNISQSGGGDVIIANTGAINTVGWVQTTGNGNIALTSTNGTATIGNSLIAGDGTGTGGVSVTATGATSDINLNTINVYSGATGDGSGTIALSAGRDIKLNPAAVTTVGSTALQAGRSVLVNGPISAGTVSINAAAGGAISGTGLITSPAINLQYLSGTSTVGILGSPLLTSGTSSVNLGMSGTGPSAVYMNHTGNVTLGNSSLFLGTNATFSFLSSGDLSVSTAIATGASDLTLSSIGGVLAASGDLSGNVVSLTAAGNFSPVGNISATNLTIDLTGAGSKFTRAVGKTVGGTASTTIKADKMDNSAATGVLGAADSLVTLLPKAVGRPITLGTDTADAGSDLELSTNELGQVTAATLRIGDNLSGAVNVGAAIAPTGITNLVLGSGSTVGQASAGTISVTNLGVKSLGTADLSTATNLVTGNIAAGLGDGSNLNSNFKFNNNSGFNVGTVDGIPGISIQISGVYNSGSPDGVISLTSGGDITQSAMLAGKALKAVGSSVTLTGSNPMGVIAGETTTGGFSYKSTNTVSVDTVDGATGVYTSSGDVSLVATGASSDISVPEGKSIQGSNVTLNADHDVVVTGGSVFSTASTGNTTVTAGRDVRVNGGISDSGDISAVNDVYITATSGKLYLTSNGTTSAAKVVAQAPYTVHLDFPGQTSGGYVIDGDSSGTVISGTNSNTGIFVNLSPAVAGSNLQVTYAAPPPPPAPTLDQCIANPALSGCSSVLPTLATCTATPTAPGCTVVLPSIATCTATPTVPGCSAVLPSIDTCTATPSAPGCSVVLPSLATCTSAPTTPGCSAVLPGLDTCIATPTAPGCSVVLPSLTICTSAPTTSGCSAVLPSLATCTVAPTTPGCSAVLPSLETCIGTPTAAGCSAVLPSLSTCTSTPTTPGCSAVLPSLSTCTSTPSTAGCSDVLPSLTSCITTPSLSGCSVVLPSLTSCITTPSLSGCSVVLPSVSSCLETPSAQGCLVVVPPQEQQVLTGGSGPVINTLTQILMTPVAPAGLQLVGLVPPPAGGENGGDDDDKKIGTGNNNQGGEPPAGDNKNANTWKMYCN
jgi:filamentous hemagglutinin family protein